LAEETAELSAGGIKGVLQGLLRFEGVDERPTLIIDPLSQNLLDGLLSQRERLV